MAALPGRAFSLIGELVVSVTSWQEDSEVFRLSVQYAQSNFKFHRFLDVNDHAITQRIEGLCEKFKIHSRSADAEGLQKLVCHFLSLRLNHSEPQSNTHYSILSVLLCTSHSPLNVWYKPAEDIFRCYQQGAMKEDVNWWHSFLLKGITLPSFSSESDEEWSSDDETKETDFGLTIAEDASAQIEKGQCSLVDKKSVHKILLNGNCDQLCHLLHYPYWYEEDYNLGSGSYVGKFSEYEVTREILWALQGSGTSFIALSSPKEKQSHHILAYFSTYASKVHDILNFVQKWELEISRMASLTVPVFGAFLAALQTYLQRFISFIVSLEVRPNMTVLELYWLLCHNYQEMCCIHSLISMWNSSVDSFLSVTPVILLSDVWVLLEEAICSSNHDLVTSMFPLAISTMRAYLQQVDKCLRPENMWIIKETAVSDVFSAVSSLAVISSHSTSQFSWTFPHILKSLTKSMCIAQKSLILMKSAATIQDHIQRPNMPLYVEVVSCLQKLSVDQEKDMTAVPLTVPFHHLITASLQNPISAMCNKVASLLLHLLEKDYCLLQHIRNIQSIFLMGAGDVMTLFSSELFKSIQMKKAWYMSSFLNGVMLESLQSHHSEVDDLIQVSVGQIPSELNHTVELVSVIHLDYKIPWPLDMIISQEDLYTYNKVFHFLMQLKWARWVLQQCHLKGFQVPSSLYSTSHCLHMLKRKLLQFVSSVDAYVLSTLHNTGLQFQRSVQQAMSLEEILTEHGKYLTLIWDQCLLSTKTKFMKEIVLKILNMCLLFGQLWTTNLQDLDKGAIEEIEQDFSKHYFFFTTYLMKSAKIGSNLHLFCLAESLKVSLDLTPVSATEL